MMHLVFDADDTLWENNIYFERAFDDFVDFLDHSALTHSEVREVLNGIELENAKIHGYGSKTFGANLQQAYRKLAERHIREEDLDRIMLLAQRILEQPIELIEGVGETLGVLAQRHELTLFTKGHPEEQRLKVDRSGLGRHFTHQAVVKEKDVQSYRALVADRGFEPRNTWMIGNSPKSDINPALDAGLNAVLIPHAHTWVLERQDLRANSDGRFRQVERFADLLGWF